MPNVESSGGFLRSAASAISRSTSGCWRCRSDVRPEGRMHRIRSVQNGRLNARASPNPLGSRSRSCFACPAHRRPFQDSCLPSSLPTRLRPTETASSHPCEGAWPSTFPSSRYPSNLISYIRPGTEAKQPLVEWRVRSDEADPSERFPPSRTAHKTRSSQCDFGVSKQTVGLGFNEVETNVTETHQNQWG